MTSYLCNFSDAAHNVRSFGYGTAKGIKNHLVPAMYVLGLAQGGNALGLSGLAANCLSVGLGVFDTAKGLFHLTNAVRDLNDQGTAFPSKESRCWAIAQNIHRVIVGLAMVNSIFAPTSLANVIVGTELLRRGFVNAINGGTQMQKSFNVTDEGKQRDWAGIGEALVTIMWAIHNSVEGTVKLYNTNILEQENISIEVHRRRAFSDLTEKSSDRHAVEMIAVWDPVRVFDSQVVPQPARVDLRDLYTVYSSHIKDENNMCRVLREVRERVGKPLDAAYIGAHGNVRGMILNSGQTVTTANVKTIAGCLKETLRREAPIFLLSCNSAKTRTGDRLGFAERLASETEHTVFASAHIAYPPECKIKTDIANTSKSIYSCVFDYKWRFFGDTVPKITNPATANVYEYNRVIERVKDARDEITAQDDWLYNLFFSKMTALIPPDVWSMLVHTQLWQDLNNRWWEKIG